MDLDSVSVHKHAQKMNLAHIQPSWPNNKCDRVVYLTCYGDGVNEVLHKPAEVGFIWFVNLITHCSRKETK